MRNVSGDSSETGECPGTCSRVRLRLAGRLSTASLDQCCKTPKIPDVASFVSTSSGELRKTSSSPLLFASSEIVLARTSILAATWMRIAFVFLSRRGSLSLVSLVAPFLLFAVCRSAYKKRSGNLAREKAANSPTTAL